MRFIKLGVIQNPHILYTFNNVLPAMSMTSKDVSFLQIFVKSFCMHFSSAVLDARYVRTIPPDLIVL